MQFVCYSWGREIFWFVTSDIHFFSQSHSFKARNFFTTNENVSFVLRQCHRRGISPFLVMLVCWYCKVYHSLFRYIMIYCINVKHIVHHILKEKELLYIHTTFCLDERFHTLETETLWKASKAQFFTTNPNDKLCLAKTQKDSECKWNQDTQQGFAVRGKNRNLLIIRVGCCDGRESCQWRHDHLRKRWRWRFRKSVTKVVETSISSHFHITLPMWNLKKQSNSKQGTGSLVLRRASSCNHIMKPPQESVADSRWVQDLHGNFLQLRLAQSPVITWKMQMHTSLQSQQKLRILAELQKHL